MWNKICAPRSVQTPPLISGTVDLEEHRGSICPGLDCLSPADEVWSHQPYRPVFKHQKKGAAERNSWKENKNEEDKKKQ